MSILPLSKKTAPNNETRLALARTVLREAGEKLVHLSATVGEEMLAAADLIVQTTGKQGRLIISGMGKSGHIGAKLAATFASTGTPAYNIHPGEAAHGDMGMLTSSDVILAIGHGGESPEMRPLLAFCTKNNIPVIALTSRPDSTLGKAAKIVLNTTVEKESCPLGLAPTTSTTVTLAMGDALAMVVMQMAGFTHDDFARLHPGGRLGARLAKVAEIMLKAEEIPFVTPETPMHETIVKLTEANFGAVGVVDENGKLTGIFTDGDLKRHLTPELLSRKTREVMTTSPRTTSPEILAIEAVQAMNEGRPVTSLFVVDSENKPLGLLRMQECVGAGVI